jgi:predicted phage tail component-like protein
MIKFKGVNFPSGVIVREVENSVLPPVNPKTIEIPSRHGGLDFGRVFGMREINVTVGVKGSSLEEVRQIVRQLASQLNSNKLESLVLEDDPDVVYQARVTGETSLSPLYRYEETTITFLCPDPFGESAEEHVTIAVQSYKTETLGVGATETFPTFEATITADSTELTLTHLLDGVVKTTLKLVDNFLIGDVIVVDCGTGKITVNGSVRPILTLDSDFIVFDVGENRTEITGSASVVIKYKTKWL